MGIFSFKSTPKPRRFNHVPIYWNPEDEEKEEREANIQKEQNPDAGSYKPSLKRGSFRKYAEQHQSDKRSLAFRKQLIKLLIILGILILLGLYLLFNSQALFSLYFENSI